MTASLNLDAPDQAGETPAASATARGESRTRSVGLKLSLVARQLWHKFDRSVERIGVSRAKWRLIAVVASRPGATQRLIAELLEISEVTAGRLIDRLCADGYLERRENPNDRRAHCVHLLPPAQPVLDKLGELAAIEESEAFAGLNESDLDTLETLLDRISRNIADARGDAVRASPLHSWADEPATDEPPNETGGCRS